MNKLLVVIASIVLLLCMTTGAIAAGSCTTSRKDFGTCWILTWTFTASAGGAVSGVGSITGVSGLVTGVTYVPGTASNLVDITIINTTTSYDVLQSAFLDSSSTASTTTNRRTPLNIDRWPTMIYNETLAPAITNAGASGTGTIIMRVDK